LIVFRIINYISCETQLERLYILIPRSANVIQHMNPNETRCMTDERSPEVVEA